MLHEYKNSDCFEMVFQRNKQYISRECSEITSVQTSCLELILELFKNSQSIPQMLKIATKPCKSRVQTNVTIKLSRQKNAEKIS